MVTARAWTARSTGYSARVTLRNCQASTEGKGDDADDESEQRLPASQLVERDKVVHRE